MKLLGNYAVVADGDAGVTTIPLPMEITDFTVNSYSSITATLPSPQITGNYTLRVFNTNEYDELFGSLTFSEEAPASKAIIVAGGGPSTDGWKTNLWNSTKTCTDYAYRALLYQGYTRENIYYLSHEPDRDVDGDKELNDIDAATTIDNLSYAVNDWAADAYDLIIYMTDHGGDGTFLLSPGDVIEAETLDNWLDNLQNIMTGRLIIIYDACRSGSFLEKLTPPTGKERVLVTSSSEAEAAFFLYDGKHSFSFNFWADIYNGSNLREAFIYGRNMMERFQSAYIDANGDGIGNETDDNEIAMGIRIGRGYIPASDIPYIGSVSEEQNLYGLSEASVFATKVTDSDGIDRVWAVITPPDYQPESIDTPVIDLETIELTDTDQDNTYDGVYTKFHEKGTYRLTIYTSDTFGNYSLPSYTTVIQNNAKGDVTGDGLTDLKDTITALKVTSQIETTIRENYITANVDVNGDNIVGLQEAIYALRKSAN